MFLINDQSGRQLPQNHSLVHARPDSFSSGARVSQRTYVALRNPPAIAAEVKALGRSGVQELSQATSYVTTVSVALTCQPL